MLTTNVQHCREKCIYLMHLFQTSHNVYLNYLLNTFSRNIYFKQWPKASILKHRQKTFTLETLIQCTCSYRVFLGPLLTVRLLSVSHNAVTWGTKTMDALNSLYFHTPRPVTLVDWPCSLHPSSPPRLSSIPLSAVHSYSFPPFPSLSAWSVHSPLLRLPFPLSSLSFLFSFLSFLPYSFFLSPFYSFASLLSLSLCFSIFSSSFLPLF